MLKRQKVSKIYSENWIFRAVSFLISLFNQWKICFFNEFNGNILKIERTIKKSFCSCTFLFTCFFTSSSAACFYKSLVWQMYYCSSCVLVSSLSRGFTKTSVVVFLEKKKKKVNLYWFGSLKPVFWVSSFLIGLPKLITIDWEMQNEMVYQS